MQAGQPELPEASRRELRSFTRYLRLKAEARRTGTELPRYELWRESFERWEKCAACGCVSLQEKPGFDCAYCGAVRPLSVLRSKEEAP
jgi:hypothetical protein